MVQHTWYVRANCDCGFSWTTENSPSVGCACGKTEIIDNAIVRGGDKPFTEQEFKQAVADDLGINVEELDLIDGGTNL